MNQLTKMFDEQELTIISNGNEHEFLLKDLCKILELGQVAGVKRRLGDDVISNHPIQDSLGRIQKATFVNEDGLYDVILDSRKPEAKRFRKWITSEVLPSIRKTGSYEIGIDTSQLSPELQMFNGLYQSLAKQEMATKQLETKVDNISSIVSLNNIDWRKKTNAILRKIADKWSGVEPYRSVKNYAYEKFEARAACNLNLRLNNRKKNAASQGMTKSYVQKINKLDCIAEEKRFIEIYIQVVKEMAIQFRVDISDLKEVI